MNSRSPYSSRYFFRYIFALALVGLLGHEFALAESVYVTVRNSKLRSKPDFFSSATAELKYGDRLEVIEASETWNLVKTTSARQGYVHQSAITTKKIILSSGAKYSPSQTDQNDVVLAGKGFSAEVERSYGAKNPNLNFREVDAMERLKVAPGEVNSFIQQGKLVGAQG